MILLHHKQYISWSQFITVIKILILVSTQFNIYKDERYNFIIDNIGFGVKLKLWGRRSLFLCTRRWLQSNNQSNKRTSNVVDHLNDESCNPLGGAERNGIVGCCTVDH